jgi:hypothetical protein
MGVRRIRTVCIVLSTLGLAGCVMCQGIGSPAFEPIDGISQSWIHEIMQDRFNRDVTEFSRTVQFRLEGTITDVVEDHGIPDEHALDQNYANPFNPATMICYAPPEESRVTLRVYSLLGEGVATLIDKVQEVGFKSVDFDATALASGAYFYRLTAGTFVETRRMVLVK